MNKFSLLALAAISSVALASAAFAEKVTFSADLKGASEVPPTTSAGTGKADVSFDSGSKKLDWTITYSELSGDATMAHFHGPAPEGKNAGPMVTIDKVASPNKGSATLTEDQAKALTSGQMYINVHTAKFPDGEIRGQLNPKK
jgi:hypothetical protein